MSVKENRPQPARSEEERGMVEMRGKADGLNWLNGAMVADATRDYPEEHRDLVRWLFACMKDRNWDRKALAEKSGISTTVLSRIFTDKYRDAKTDERVDLTNVCGKIARFKELLIERERNQRLPFIETSVWQRIDGVCREALVDQCFAFVYGESQIGKTASLLEHRRRNNHGCTSYLKIEPSGGVPAFRRALAAALNIGYKSSWAELRPLLAKCLDPGKLVIVDETHEAFASSSPKTAPQIFALMRQIQEDTGCGFVLCGTNVWRDQLERGVWAQQLKQLRKRGIWELQLEDKPTKEDLNLIAAHYELGAPTKDAAKIIDWVARTWGLGKFCKFLARGARRANSKKEKFAWHHFVKVVETADQLATKPKEEK